ncbi:hypothetical protein LEBR102806_03505 [Levilactobacillus brevis]|nr:hypothetical protein S101174_00160 [Levilactobacillus brevis]ARW51880.1 hypothetical protein S101106_02428 [Levilactobacillus brevis]SQG74595.1 Uncharacterised protein [Levilactobacillus brevis]
MLQTCNERPHFLQYGVQILFYQGFSTSKRRLAHLN